MFKISFVSDKCDINLYFDISFLKIGQISTEVQELEDQNAVSHENSELFIFTQLIYDMSYFDFYLSVFCWSIL